MGCLNFDWQEKSAVHEGDGASLPPSLPEYGHAQVLSVPQDELDPLVVVGKADVAGEVDAGAGEAGDLRRVAACKRGKGGKAELIIQR